MIEKYLPSDYYDIVSKRIKVTIPLTPDCLFEQMFCNFPRPVAWLMELRSTLVKPLGLQGGGSFQDLISERDDEEIVICKDDKHLCFWVGIYCSKPNDGWQDASVTTVVKYNNFLGRLYFIGIWVFHKILVKSLFKRALGKH